MYIFLLLKQTLWPLKTHANTDSDMAKGQCLCYLQAGIFARHGTLVPQKMRFDGDADAAGSRSSSRLQPPGPARTNVTTLLTATTLSLTNLECLVIYFPFY